MGIQSQGGLGPCEKRFRGKNMKEFVDFRLSEEWASRHLDESWGQHMVIGEDSLAEISSYEIPASLMTRQIVLETRDPRLAILKEKILRFPPCPMTGMNTRQYADSELSEATLLNLMITTFVDACGEDFGTLYDESEACPMCGFGRRQISLLKLDLGLMPNEGGFATTIARGEELVVSESVAQIVRKAMITGCRLD